MRIKIIFIYFWLTVFFLSDVIAQSYSYRHFTPEDGVSSSTVYCSTQDSKGFMWFGTETGACRFDGIKFTRFSMDDGLSDNEIFQIHEDSQGRIWFLTFNGRLSWFKDGVFHNPDNDSILGKAIAETDLMLSFYEDHQRNIWIGTFRNGFIRIDSFSVTGFTLADSNNDDQGMYVLEDDGLQKIWGVKYNAIVEMKNGPERKSVALPTPIKNGVYTPDHSILFLGEDGIIYTINSAALRAIPLVKISINTLLVHNLYTDPAKNIWLSTTSSGCYKYSFKNGSYKLSEQLLKGKTVYSVFVDKEGNTWFTTAGEGIYMLPEDYKNHYSYTVNDGLEEMQINSLAKDNEGNTWLGLSNSKINVITENGLKYYRTVKELQFYNRVLSIYVDQNNAVWCATDKGLCVFKNGINSKPEVIESVQHPSLKNIVQNPVTKGIELTSNGGILKLVPDKSAPEGFTTIVDSSFIFQRTFTHNYDHEGHLWIGNIEGLNFYDGKKLVKYGRGNKLLQTRITDIKEFRNNLMVIATYGKGIVFFKNGKILQVLTVKEELPGNICKQIFIKDSTVWVATNLGLSKIIYEGSAFKVKQNFNSRNGLLSNNVNGVVDDGQRLFVATDRGLTILNKNVASKNTDPPYLYITRVTTDDSSYKELSIPPISYRNRRLVLEFTAVTFKNPSDVKYQYRLNENVNTWIETKNNSVEFSLLSPGDYVFEIRAKKVDSGWSKPATFSFTVIPPFWETLSFRLIAGSILIFGLYTLIRFYSTRKLRRQLAIIRQKQAIEAERNRIATDMHDDLGSDLTKITIWSSIIESENEKLETIKPYNKEISDTANSLLKKMDEIIWTLNPTNDTLLNLCSYLHQFALNFFESTPVKCYLVINDDIPEMIVSSAFRRSIFLAFKESLNNVLKHAGANRVNIEVEVTEHLMEINIVDNGKGFELIVTSSKRHGLTNLKKRLENIGGHIRIKSEKGIGTLIKISVPLEQIGEHA